MSKRKEALDRILKSATLQEGCLITGLDAKSRYARPKVDGKRQAAHRVVWEEANGPVPEGMDVHHRCHQTRCVNLEHLELKGHGQHKREHYAEDGHYNAKKTHCPQKHPLSGENLRVDKRGRRSCRACQSVRDAGRKR